MRLLTTRRMICRKIRVVPMALALVGAMALLGSVCSAEEPEAMEGLAPSATLAMVTGVGGGGYYILNGAGFSTGQVPSYGAAPQFFSDLFFSGGVDILVDMELSADANGNPTGMVVLDGFGAEFTIGAAPEYEQNKRPYWLDPRDPRLLDPIEDPSLPADFVFPGAVSLVFVRDDAGSTQSEDPIRAPGANGIAGYYILDNYGGVHLINNNFPDRQPVFAAPVEDYDADPQNIFFKKYENYGLTTSGSGKVAAAGDFLYWGFDAARDMEPSVNFSEVSGGQFNGYYILDLAGGVHTNLGPAVPASWQNEPRPYFVDGNGDPADLAVAFKVTPRQDGYVLLDKFGGVFFVGAGARQYAENTAIPNRLPPVFGLPIMIDLELVTGPVPENPEDVGPNDAWVTGMYVLDEFGTVYNQGLAPYLGGPGLTIQAPFYRDIEVSPVSRALTDTFQN